MKTLKLALFAIALTAGLKAQQIVPNTTLCAAITSTTVNSICLTATSGSSPNWTIVNQTGIYVDNEYMLVTLSNNQIISGSNRYVNVTRSNRSGPGASAQHASGAVAWIAVVPVGGLPGANGFVYGTQLGDVGACSRGTQTFLPHIWVDRGKKTDCVGLPGITSGTLGAWTDFYNPSGDPQGGGDQAITTNGALSVSSGNYVITKAGVEAMTLAAPVAGAQDGMTIIISSTTANAHTLTATGLLQTGTASVNLATFAAQAGAGLVLRAYNGKWIVVSSVGITFS